MSDTSSDDMLDGLVEDAEENLNESDADEEVDVDEDILEALEGDLAEQASDADDDSDNDSDDSDDESESEVAPSTAVPQSAVDISVPVINLDQSDEYEYYGSQQPTQSPPQSSPPPGSRTQSEERTSAPKERSPSPAFLRKLSLFPRRPNPKSYTVEAICALPHPTPSYALASTPCMSHMLTGSEDGYIRDYDLFTGLNGKTFLSAPQRHHCAVVEGILKYAPIRMWWENPSDVKREEGTDEPSLSPVYSLLMQSDALWSLAGTESGNINLFTVRHEPGRLCHVLQGHRGVVSAMSMAHDEKSFFSAGWDGVTLHWDLNTGQAVRNFTGHGSQLTAVAVQPLNQPATGFDDDMEDIQPTGDGSRDSDTGGGAGEGDDAKSDASYDTLFDEPDADGAPDPDLTNGSQDRGLDLSLPGTVPNPQFNRHIPSSTVPKNAPPLLDPHTYFTYSSDVLMTASIDGQIFLWDRRVETQGNGVGRLFMSDRTPPWCVSACWSVNGTQIYAGRRNGTVDIWDVRKFGSNSRTPRHLKVLRNPASSGVVSCVVAFPDGRHLASASIDNIRLWNVAEVGEFDRKVKSGVQFKIIAGHHGGFVSQMLVDPGARFLVTACGNRGWHGESTRTVFVHEIKSTF